MHEFALIMIELSLFHIYSKPKFLKLYIILIVFTFKCFFDVYYNFWFIEILGKQPWSKILN